MNFNRGPLRAAHTAGGETVAVSRVLAAAVRAQFNITRRTVYDLAPMFLQPAFTLVLMAVFKYAGREDLSSYALVATMLMGVSATAISIASDLMSQEQDFQTFELVLASPAPFSSVLLTRMMVITSISLIGMAESWLIIRLVFDVSLSIHHPWVFVATMLLTAFAAAGTALVPAALFTFARSARTYQNSITYPVYIFSGILVPLTVFPDWLAPISRVIFLYWSGELLRDSMQTATPEGVVVKLGAIALLGVGPAIAGAVLIARMIHYLKREGRLGIL